LLFLAIASYDSSQRLGYELLASKFEPTKLTTPATCQALAAGRVVREKQLFFSPAKAV